MWHFNNKNHLKLYMLPGENVYVVYGKSILKLIMTYYIKGGCQNQSQEKLPLSPF